MGEGRSEEKVLVIPWGSGQRGKGDHCRFPAQNLELDGVCITRAVEEVWFCFQPLGTRGLWVSSGWTKLLRLASGTEQQIGIEVRRGLCVIQERWEGQRRHLRCSWGLELGERDRDRKEVCSTWFSGR